MNIWFTSDTHFSHTNIVKGCSRWDDTSRCRDFSSLHEHNKAIVKGINQKVAEDDTLYHLGDWSFGGIEKIWLFRKQLRCRNVHLILGNHDHHIEKNRLIKIPLTDSEKFLEVTNKPELLHEINMDGSVIDDVPTFEVLVVPVKSIFKSVQHVKTFTVNRKTFFLSHYAHRVWNKSHHGVIHLYGHSHNTIDNNHGKSMDVGIEAAIEILKEPRPFHIDEIVRIMDSRSVKQVDHHDKNTN